MNLKHNILIVDDDVDDREIIRDAFEKNLSGHHYVFIENGVRLLEYLLGKDEHETPSLISLTLTCRVRMEEKF
jgi:CheY-like chemotaxis protein